MRHWKESLITTVLVVLVLSLSGAMATDYNWNVGYGNWSDASKWTPAGGPPSGTSDRAFVGTLHFASQVYLSSDTSVNYLSVEDDLGGTNWVWTAGRRLLVYDTTNLIETTGSVILYVASGVSVNDFDTNYLNIYGGAELSMDGGLAQIDNRLFVDPSSSITGFGTIEFNSSHLTALSLAGTLRTDTGSLTLQMTGSGKLDLDGSSGGNSVIDVTTGTSSLIIDAYLSDHFDGMMTIGEGNSVDFTQAWTHSGTLNFNAGAGIATLSGARVTVNQGIYANSGVGKILADVVFNPGTSVGIVGGATLQLHGNTTYNSSSYTGGGILAQYGDATVTADTIIGTNYYDWDGGGASETTVNPGITFTINTDQIDLSTPATDGFDGTVNINSGTLLVSTIAPWAMEGTMNLNYVGGGTPQVSGADMIVRDSSFGEGINVTGPMAYINSNVTFESTARTNVASGSTLYLQIGHTTYKGGTHTGAGTLSQTGNATVAADTTIDTARYDWDGWYNNTETTVNDGVTFTINSAVLDAHDGVVNVNGGAVVVNSPWTMEGTLNLEGNSSSGGELHGSEMTLGSTGTLNLIPFGRVHAPITVEGTVNVDGFGRFYDATVFESTASVNLADAGSRLYLSGPTTFRGGSYTGVGRLDHSWGDTVVVEANTTIDVATYDWDGLEICETTINPGVTFTINSNQLDTFYNQFDGTVNINSGTLAVNTTDPWVMHGTMNLAGGLVIGKDLINDGTIRGYGTIAAAGLTNNGTLSADGGTLVIDTTSFPDLDGNAIPETGVLEALTGNMRVTGNLGGLFIFDGQVNVSSSREFRMDNYGLANRGLVSLRGGTYVAPQFSNLSTGTLGIGIGGLNPGSEHGQMVMSGLASLDGTLDLSLIGEFMPAYYDEFEILTAGSVIGRFDLITGMGITPVLSLATVYNADNITIVAALPGDANLDREVDVGDLGILAGNYGSVGGQTWATGDFNGDGNVDVGDLGILAGNYDSSVPTTIPEPATLVLLGLGGVAMIRRRRRKR